MRTFSMITLVVLSLSSSAIAAEGWNFRGRFLPNFTAAPQPGTVEASTAIDGPAAEPVPAEAVPAPAANAYGQGGNYGYGGFGGNGNSGCSSCNGNGGGYFNFSWYGGCCEQQQSCCSNIWDSYCSQKKSWCNHHHKAHCCQQAPTCEAAPKCEAAPACDKGCGGHHGAWMNGGHFAHHCRSMLNGWGHGGNGCSDCGEGSGEMVYGKPAIGDEVPSEPAPVAEPTPAPIPAPRLQPKPAPLPPKPMAREAFRPYLPSFRMMPTSFGF